MAAAERNRLELSRVLRGATRRAVEDVLSLLVEPTCVEDARGTLVLGSAAVRPEAPRWPVVVGEAVLGAVRGGEGAARVASLVAFLWEREAEKHALAAETLGRYKELTVLYEMSSALSRVLDVDAVAARIVSEAHRFLRASHAALYLADRRRERLQPLATAGGEARVLDLAERSLEARSFHSAQAELVEESEEGGSVLVAPLRAGESSLGLLRIASQARAQWTAGELKLVTSLAANAASAISHAMLHREQLRQQALRNQLERFVSPSLLEAALDGAAESVAHEPVAVLFTDAGQVARSVADSASTQEVLAAILQAASASMEVLLSHGATLSTAQGEMLVALFTARERGPSAAHSAAEAARALLKGALRAGPGVGVACLGVGTGLEAAAFFEGVGTAASLHAAAEGRILVDGRIARQLRAQSPHGEGRVPHEFDLVAAEAVSAPRGSVEAYEVRP